MNLQWMTTKQAAEQWGISLRYAQRLLVDGCVLDAKKHGRCWLIPHGTEKPAALQKKSAVLSSLSFIWGAPLHGQEAESVGRTIKNDALRKQYAGEIAYMRGDFSQARLFFTEAQANESVCIGASLSLLLTAISTNDFELYSQIEASLRQRIETAGDPHVAALAETALAAVAVCMFAPEMAPGWLRKGDFSHLPEEAAPFALYLRTKYLQNHADYPQMFTIAQTMLTLCKGKGAVMTIYLLLMCAAACVGLGKRDQACDYLMEALAIGMPHGFITPFVENVATLNGLVEKCVKRHYPHAYNALLAQWQETWKNWTMFHNRFARDNVPLLLTLRELRIATLAATRVPYEQIAQQEGISVGRVRNIMQEIYGKLFVRSRAELADLVLWKPKKT